MGFRPMCPDIVYFGPQSAKYGKAKVCMYVCVCIYIYTHVYIYTIWVHLYFWVHGRLGLGHAG